MELRPRKGRSVQPPSTPTIAKPSPRPPPQSSSRKKQASVPSTPVHILSDNEDQDPKEIRMTPIDGAPEENHAGKVSAAASSENRTLKQGNQDINLSDDVEFETPLSSIAKLRRSQIKVSSSAVKSKTKVTASNNEKMAKLSGSTPVADTCITYDVIAATLEKVGLDENVNGKVYGAPGNEAASQEIQKQEAITGSAPPKGDELAVEITLSAREVCSKKTQILSPSIDVKQVHSSKKKSGKKRNEKAEVVDTKLDQGGHLEHIADVDALLASEPRALFLVLSDDETVQVSDSAQVDGREEKISPSKEAALEMSLPSAEVSKMSRETKKSQSYKKNITEDEGLSRKLSEETSDATISCTGTNSDDRSRNELGLAANSSKERTRRTEIFEVKDYAETGISTGERHNFKSFRTSLKGREVTDIDINEDKLDAFDRGIKGRDIVIEGLREVSEELLDEAASPGEEMDKEISSVHAELDAATASSQKNVVHDKECRSSDADDSNAYSGSDSNGEEDDEMASIFFKSMKANLQRISEPSGSSMQKVDQTKQDAVVRLESQSAKSVVKKPSTNGRSTGYGLSWCPEGALSASKTSKASVGKPRSVVEVSADTFWGKNRCLQDGLCVPPVDPLKLNKLARKQKEDTAGAKWFNLSAPTITPEIKKELQLVKLRGALDPKRHYKADDSKGLPKYFQVGTVVGGPADFYSGRLTKKEQKSSLASELLSDSSLSAYRKRKYLEIQEQKQAGGKGFWKKKKSKRTPAWANI